MQFLARVALIIFIIGAWVWPCCGNPTRANWVGTVLELGWPCLLGLAQPGSQQVMSPRPGVISYLRWILELLVILSDYLEFGWLFVLCQMFARSLELKGGLLS
jgi:hypothetical protein